MIPMRANTATRSAHLVRRTTNSRTGSDSWLLVLLHMRWGRAVHWSRCMVAVVAARDAMPYGYALMLGVMTTGGSHYLMGVVVISCHGMRVRRGNGPPCGMRVVVHGYACRPVVGARRWHTKRRHRRCSLLLLLWR